MDYYELELARREDELEDMRQAEREENRFLLAIIAILAGGAGAALMLAGTALLAMFFVLSYPGITSPAQASVSAPAVPSDADLHCRADGHGCTAIRANGIGQHRDARLRSHQAAWE